MKVLASAPAQSRGDRHATALLHDEPNARVIGFRLDAGQEVPAHTSPSTVIVVVTAGEGVFIGADTEAVLQAGQSAVYAPGELHSIRAREALSFLAVIAPRPL